MKQAIFQIVNTEYELVENIKIDPEYSLLVPILSDEEYTRLKESVAEVGLYEPIIINHDKVLLDGHHRLKAYKELGKEKINVERKHFEDRVDEEIYVIETNVVRRQLIDYQKTVLGLKLEPLYRKRAEKNMKAGVPLAKNLAKVRTDEVVANKMGINRETYRQAKHVLNEANENELKDFKKGVKKVYTIFKNIKTRKKIEQLNKEIQNIDPITGKYDVVVIDPPWDMDILDQGSWRGGVDYPRMTLDEIKAISIPAKDDCVLWLWVTTKYLHEAFHIIEQWGFEQKSVLTWIKDKMGVGVWLRGQTDHCILAIKGKPLWQLKGQTTALIAPTRGHSVKPDEFYDLVDSLCYGAKLDYFARKPREGWFTYGTMEENNGQS